MLKNLFKKFLNKKNYQISRISDEEKLLMVEYPGLDYRQICYFQAMVKPLEVGEISISEGRFLARIVASVQSSGPIIEVGSLYGQSTRILLTAKPEDNQVISVDNYSWNPLNLSSIAHRGLIEILLREAIKNKELSLIQSDKNEFYSKEMVQAPAMVFLDADHSYQETARDIEWAKESGAKIICGHDYDTKQFPGVVRAVNEHGGPSEIVGTLWLL